MIRFAEKKDIAAIVPLILVILKDMELPFLAEYGEKITTELIQEAATDPTYRYGYRRGIVKEINGEIAGAAFGYPAHDEPLIDEPFQKALKNPKFKGVTGELFTDPETLPNEWYLDSIAVAPKFRSQGVGSELLEALPMIAKRDQEQVIGLNVDRANPRARGLYLKRGFTDVGDCLISGHLYDHMQKKI